MKKSKKILKKCKRRGQSMTEYIVILSIGAIVGIPMFSMLTRALMNYLAEINKLLNYPLP